MIPVGVRGEACHDGMTQLPKVVRETGHLLARDARIDEQDSGPPLHDDGVVPEQLALVDQDTLHDLSQHGWLLPLMGGNRSPGR